MISIKDLSVSIGSIPILHGVDLQIKPGIITTFLGPNGAGKTTLLKTISGLLSTGQPEIESEKNCIFFNQKLINKFSVSDRVKMGIAYLPQETSLFKSMSVLDNLKMVFKYHPCWNGKSWEVFEKEINQLFSVTSFKPDFQKKSGTLSGGQKRILEVVRTILMNPRIALFDEPFAGIDPKSIYELKEIFLVMAKEKKCS